LVNFALVQWRKSAEAFIPKARGDIVAFANLHPHGRKLVLPQEIQNRERFAAACSRMHDNNRVFCGLLQQSIDPAPDQMLGPIMIYHLLTPLHNFIFISRTNEALKDFSHKNNIIFL